jgi:hypothetical protein
MASSTASSTGWSDDISFEGSGSSGHSFHFLLRGDKAIYMRLPNLYVCVEVLRSSITS